MASKQVSFHIGVQVYDPSVYKEAPDLLSSADDAREMYNLAVRLGYTALDLKPRGSWDGTSSAPPNVLTNKAAAYQPVVSTFNQAAALLQDEGDRCLITFSGHGTQLEKDPPLPDPEGKFNEVACLFDFPLIDDVIAGLLGDFNKGVEVFLVLDCCHAGPTSKKPGLLLEDDVVLAPPPPRAELRKPSFGIRKAAETADIPPPPLPSELLAKFKGFDRNSLKANVVAFLACGDTENTFDGKNPGDLSVYTRKFIDAVGDGTRSVRDVAAAIEVATPQIDICHPRFQHTTTDETFLEKPMKD